MLCFNNHRLLHAREEFQLTEASGRHVEGAYLEWSEVNSKLKVLKEQLKL